MFDETDPVSGSTKTVETERVKVRQITVCEEEQEQSQSKKVALDEKQREDTLEHV